MYNFKTENMFSSKFKIVSLTLFILTGFSLANYAQDETLKLYKKNNKKQWLKTFSESSSGLLYKIEQLGHGKSPYPGDLVTVHYIGFFDNDTVFDSSYKRGTPLSFNYGVGQVIKGWDEGLSFLKEGGKAVFKVPPHLAYGNRAVSNIKAGSTLYFQVELIKVKSIDSFKQFNTTGLDTVSLSSGLKYMIVENGQGDFIDSHQWVYLHFVGYLPSGKIFDASALRGEPIRYSLNSTKMPAAFDSVLPLMKTGSQFHVISPAKFAYGHEGIAGVVPANTPVEFDIQVMYTTPKVTPKPFNVDGKDTVETQTGLKYIVVEEGEGRVIKENDVVKIHFSGYFENGELFQSSLTNDDDIIFVVGQEHVIDGLDQLVRFMLIGGKVRALIPWKLGYGAEGNFPEIPPKANLIFDVELVTIAE